MESALGFHSPEKEQPASLAVDGSLPEWLTGSLVRNGPGSFSISGEGSVDHWFDGLATCYRFTFDPGNQAGGSVDGAEDAGHSRLLVLDGERFEERARVSLPHAAPFDFHGRYFPELQARTAVSSESA